MRLLLLPSVLFFLWGLLLSPTTLAWSTLEDMEASGDDLEGSGGDLKEVVLEDKARNLGQSKENSQSNEGIRTDSQSQLWDGEEITVEESSSFLERTEIFAGVVAGALAGLALAVLLAGILIYKWQKKDEAGYIQGQMTASNQDYYKDTHHHRREEVILV